MIRVRPRSAMMSMLVAMFCSFNPSPAAARQAPALSAEDARLIADFNRAVEQHVELHRRLEGTVPTVEVSADPAEVRRAMDALAMKIRAARVRARQGDVFSPEIAPLIRRLIAQGCGGAFTDLRAIIDEENPYAGSMRPCVNASYPKGAPVSMMPPNVLCALPELPPELEFRFMDRSLILWDAHADLIVDYLPDAIPAT